MKIKNIAVGPVGQESTSHQKTAHAKKMVTNMNPKKLIKWEGPCDYLYEKHNNNHFSSVTITTISKSIDDSLCLSQMVCMVVLVITYFTKKIR